MSIYEAGMLICFGASWPFSLWKLWSTKQCGGVSMRFYALVVLGYLLGVVHKILYNYDFVVWLYVLNALMVTAAMILVAKYRWRDRNTCKNKENDPC